MESTIRERQKGYCAALAKSDAAGSSEAFVEFMLETIRDTLLPYAKLSGVRDIARKRALAYFESNPKGNVSALAAELGCSQMEYSYIQVALTIMDSQKTEEREYRPLEAIRDNYPKYVVTRSDLIQSRNGIIHVNAIDFMLDGRCF